MRSRVARRLLTVLVVAAGAGCGGTAMPPPDETMCVKSADQAALAPPPGAQPGEPYRWLARSWRSPLGLTVRTYGLAVDGVAIHGRRQVEIDDQRGTQVYRAGTGDAVLAELRARGTSAWAAWRHPRVLAPAAGERTNPLAHTRQRAVWHYADGDLVPAVVTERVDLLGDAPVGEVILRDAVTGAELSRHRTIFDLADPKYLVYARDDGRPLCSPLGHTLPHPTGRPDGTVPPPVMQQLRAQSLVVDALPDPWLPASSTQTRGNNVVAFFDSLLDRSGNIVVPFDDEGNDTPEYGPEPDGSAQDMFASASGDGFEFRYDPTRTVSEYFQAATAGTASPPPDPRDAALNAKIVQGFYATNWLHDYFYRAGYDELAGNPQQSNLGRGGKDCDPLIVHAGFLETFTLPATEGESPVMDIGLNTRSASRRDATMDFTVLGHEWGHTLIGRVAGATDEALGNVQGMALHEAIADFVGILVNIDAGDDLHGAFAVGSYDNLDYIERRATLPPAEAPADAMYYGVRRFPYSLDLAKNPLTFRNLAEPPSQPYYNWKGRGPLLSESHTTGEIFSQGLFQCFGNLVAAHPGASFETMRARMAKYLVAGLAAFPEHPSLLDARNAFLGVIRLTNPADDYPACRAGFAVRGMGADTVGPDREFGSDDPFGNPPYDPADVQESFLDQDRAVRLLTSMFAPTTSGTTASGTARVEVRNTGLIELAAVSLAITPAVPAAVTFPNGARVDLAALAPEQTAATAIAIGLNLCGLPLDPAQAGFRSFDYAVAATAPGADGVSHSSMYHVSVAAPAACAALE